MKKIEAIVLRADMPSILAKIQKIGCTVMDKRNLEDGAISYNQKSSRVGSTSVSSVPLSKIDLVVADKDARSVIEIISEEVKKSPKLVGKIFVSEMTEILDMKTSQSEKELEIEDIQRLPTFKSSRNRLVSLQKHTLARIEKIYEENQETLAANYRIRSFNDFVNHCVMSQLKVIEKQLRHPEITFEDRF